MLKTLLQVNNGNWCQEHYEMGSKDLKERSKALRQLGYQIYRGYLKNQITQYGRINITCLSIFPGKNDNTYELPQVENIIKRREK